MKQVKTNDVCDIFDKKFDAPPLLFDGMIEKLRLGDEVEDNDFDRIFPRFYQLRSTVHWSSIEVARQIAAWIRPLHKRTFLDIGCGVGKLCILLGVLTEYEIHGIEQRINLVRIANEILKINKLKHISVTQKNMLDLDWQNYDIYYLYNPFQEHIIEDVVGIIEGDVEFDKKHYAHYTSEVFRQLTWAKPGKVLITFHGYGGPVPSDWKMLESRHIENGDLTMWIKESV